MRLQYHRTYGYFLSVSKAKASKVPDHWIRRQTLANEERFITSELKSREGKSKEYRLANKMRHDPEEAILLDS